jgi:hypothetical protein
MTDSDMSTVLNQARAAIGADGELPFSWRRRIWQLFVDRMGSDAGTQAWGKVQVACARHAQPVWQAMFPDEDRPFDLLTDVEEQVTSGRADPAKVEPELGRLKAYLDGKFELGSVYFSAIYAGFAAFAAAADLLHPQPPPDHHELEGDPMDWDACFNASLAHAGGATWEEGVGDPDARRAYWDWFLSEPVSQFGAG